MIVKWYAMTELPSNDKLTTPTKVEDSNSVVFEIIHPKHLGGGHVWIRGGTPDQLARLGVEIVEKLSGDPLNRKGRYINSLLGGDILRPGSGAVRLAKMRVAEEQELHWTLVVDNRNTSAEESNLEMQNDVTEVVKNYKPISKL